MGGFLDGIAYSNGTMWISDLDGNRVIRLAAEDARRRPDIAVPEGPLTVVATERSVWVASYNGSVVTRFTSANGARDATIPTPGPRPCGLVVAAGRLWVLDQSDGSAGTADVAGAALTRFDQPARAGFASGGFGAIWVPDFSGSSRTVSRIDLASRAVRRIAVGNQPIMALAGGDSVWVSNTVDATVTRIAPRTGAVRATIRVPGGQTGGLAFARGVLWVASYGGASVAAIDPRSGAVLGTVAVPGPAENIAADPAGNLWVTQADGTVTELRPRVGSRR
ncbi:MAG TPA: hypothetical protein VGN18_12885 [Jatrophihabitans sp.]|uniref:Vgb family protein n=1 Tax=Jatrophihabitans sp. TaxID=1932789 RepID=UPI002E05C584|nr:hypothetical protein [Jatrophihabitans sp.]